MPLVKIIIIRSVKPESTTVYMKEESMEKFLLECWDNANEKPEGTVPGVGWPYGKQAKEDTY